MPLSKQQRVYFSVLGLAALAWSVDRFVLHGGVTAPAGAQASSLLIAHATPLGPIAPLADQPAVITSLGQRLDQFSAQLPETSTARDVFAPPASWIPQEKPVASVAEADSTAQLVADFRQSHTITAIIRAGRNSQVFLGSQIARLGEQVDGWRLVSVTESSATFDLKGVPAVVRLADPRDGGMSSPAASRKAK